MKWFLFTLAIGLAASDKLDRTYLPPPGAQFAGGTLGHHDAPLAPPLQIHSGQTPMTGAQKGTPPNFGDRIPKVPVTTTSYAYSQTTTYPPREGYETIVLPINPVTGFPINQGNYPHGPTPNVGINIQPGFVSQGPTSAPINYGSPGYDQFNQPKGQFPQNVITPGGTAQIPGSAYPGQSQGQFQYPGGQANQGQQGFLPTDINQQSGQNVVNPGGVAQIPGGNLGLIQYPAGQSLTGQQGFIPTTDSSINLRPGGNQYGVNYDGSSRPTTQGTYTGQPINVQNLGETQPTQTSILDQKPINIGGSSQYLTGNQNYRPSDPTGSENLYQTGTTPTIPSSYYNGVSSTTPYPDIPSSTSAYSSVGPIYRSERPQAAADRNAVILNYENIRTPDGYSYSFDTSNGIHADESGIVDNGTKAQGAYSYIGDDGKVYSVIYTADENGFQPRGDHLPTPPPIPEAIKKVIEQAAKDKAAGIVHDGSYDETKYGDKGNQEIENRRRQQNGDTNRFSNKHFNADRDDSVKSVVGIKDDKYDGGIVQDQFNNNLPATSTQKDGKLPVRPSSNKIIDQNNDAISEGNRRVSDVDSLNKVQKGTNQQNGYGTYKHTSSGRRPVSNGVDLPFIGTENTNRNNQPESKNREPFERHPVSGGVKYVSETKYPGSHVDVGTVNYSGEDDFDNVRGVNIESGNPSVSPKSDENLNTHFDSVTGAPVISNKKQILKQRIKGSRRPGSSGNRYNQNKNGEPIQRVTEQDGTGYDYQQPNTKFEQNKFPTRFSTQKGSLTRKPDQYQNEYVEGTTRKPFMTPNVYNQKNKNTQSTPTNFNQNDIYSQSTTRRPFTTVGVTSPSRNSYNDYDFEDDYVTDQDIVDDKIASTRPTGEKKGITSRPYQSTHKTSRPQYVPHGQRERDNQKGSVTPGQNNEYSPGYIYGSTTPMPSHNSRFGSTETPRRSKPQRLRPSTTIPDSTTGVDRPVNSLSGNRQPDFKYSSDNVGSGYPTTSSFPVRGSITPNLGVSTPQDYYTSTYGPRQDYGTSTIPPTTQVSTQSPGSLQSTLDETFHTGYHYGPPKSGTFNPDTNSGPGSFTLTGNLGVYPPTPTGIYQTNYQQGPGIFPSTTSVPITPGSQGTFIPSQFGTTAPESSSFGVFQGNYQNGPSTPDYATTIISSTPDGKPVFENSNPLGYEFGPSRPTYFTTDSPTSDSIIPSGITGPSRKYPSTSQPGFQSTQDTSVDGPVDGFGRPILTEQGSSHPGFGHPTQGTTGPINNVEPNIGTDQSTTYPGGYDPNRVIGEDFSGPKQPQRYDPKTGYHY